MSSEFDYERAVWGQETLRPDARSLAGYRLAEALRALPARGAVLEFGCGAGRNLEALGLARPDLQRVGIDVSRTALAHAAARMPDVELRRPDDPDDPEGPLPAADGEFDAVLVLDVLEHLADPARVLAELHRVVKPGGALHLQVPCEGDALSVWRWLPPPARYWKRDLGGHVQRFRRAELVQLVRNAGFAIERVRYSLHLAGNLADVGAFAALAATARLRPDRPPPTTGTLMASTAPDRAGSGRRLAAGLIRGVDAILWLEAKVLGRVPSWNVHLTARRPVAGDPSRF